jgi:vitamin B12 transporter
MFFSQSQIKTLELQSIDVPSISDTLNSYSLKYKINRSQILSNQPEDLGTLTNKIPGITLKNYGGIGGLKTISFRGVSGTHTSLLVNGFSVINNQIGQIDLSTLHTDNIESFEFSVFSKDFLTPSSALLMGNILSIQTFENKLSTKPFQLRFQNKIGSFGQLDNYLGVKFKLAKFHVGMFAKYRSFNGKYPYHFQNGSQIYSGNRINNDLKEGYLGCTISRVFARSKVSSTFSYNDSDKGLPGAVILYSSLASQRLKLQNYSISSDYLLCSSTLSLRVFNTVNFSDMIYIDSSFLNNDGFLINHYKNKYISSGFSISKDSKDSSKIYVGIEHTFSSLDFSLISPYRNHFQSVLGYKTYLYKIKMTSQIGMHNVFNTIDNLSITKNVFVPSIELNKNMNFLACKEVHFFAKRTFRMPSFSEMYYANFGNKNVLPEIANQLDAGTSFHFFKDKLSFHLDGYFNLVENKIVAIPTKNLFVWSIQNVGEVQAKGIDLLVNSNWKIRKHYNINLSGNYSFQSVEDISAKSSVTYRNQIAYIPKHTGNLSFTFDKKKKLGFSIQSYTVSSRFALNENNNSNKVSSFSTLDGSIYYTFQLQKAQKIRVSFFIKNMLNSSYAYINYYVMPGINYLFALNYEI